MIFKMKWQSTIFGKYVIDIYRVRSLKLVHYSNEILVDILLTFLCAMIIIILLIFFELIIVSLKNIFKNCCSDDKFIDRLQKFLRSSHN